MDQEVTQAARYMALAQSAALKHLGYDSMEDAHYWAKDDYDLNRLDALVAVIQDALSDALATAEADIAALREENVDLRADRDALWKALHDATSIIGHAVPMDTVVLAGRKLVAREVWQAAHDLLYPKAAKRCDSARAALTGARDHD